MTPEKINFLTPSIWYPPKILMNSQSWGHLWEILFSKPYQKVNRNKSFFPPIVQLWSQNFQKGCAPIGEKNSFPTFKLKISLGLEHSKSIKFHHNTDFNLLCVLKYVNITTKWKCSFGSKFCNTVQAWNGTFLNAWILKHFAFLYRILVFIHYTEII